MRKLIVFNNISLDGYFVDNHLDMSWAHAGNDQEWNEFTAENAKGGGELLFGRVTYDLMASYWPTPLAAEQQGAVAKAMNELPKVVFSRSLKKATWQNTRLVKGDLATEISKLKEEEGAPMVMLGSGNVVAQLATLGLVDIYQLALSPIALGGGRSLFEGVDRLHFKLTQSRTFGNGKVFLTYEPA